MKLTLKNKAKRRNHKEKINIGLLMTENILQEKCSFSLCKCAEITKLHHLIVVLVLLSNRDLDTEKLL